jgi:hypothetical protein
MAVRHHRRCTAWHSPAPGVIDAMRLPATPRVPMLQRCSSSPRRMPLRAAPSTSSAASSQPRSSCARRFPGITDNAQARECARTIAGWKSLRPVKRLPKPPRLRRVPCRRLAAESDTVRAARLGGCGICSEEIAAPRALPFLHAGHRLPGLGIDCPRRGFVLPSASLVHGLRPTLRARPEQETRWWRACGKGNPGPCELASSVALAGA